MEGEKRRLEVINYNGIFFSLIGQLWVHAKGH